MRKKITTLISIIIIASFSVRCGQIIKGERGNIQNLTEKARKNIMTAESISDIKRKSDLLKAAESQINDAGTLVQKDPSIAGEIDSVYAYFYYVSGDYANAKKYAAKNSGRKDAFLTVLTVRISLKEKGKEYARTAIGILESILPANPHMLMARLTLGDSHFILGNFQEAQKHYTEVLKTGEAFQVQAADRLELLDQIRRTGIDTGKIQNLIFSIAVRRDEVADLLQRVFNADRYLKFGKTDGKKFKDTAGSLYSESIRILLEKGFFTYISGENFEPFKAVTRGEMSKIVEDFLVLKSGNNSLRTRYMNDSKSSIKGIEVKDSYYNAVKTAIEAKAIIISLDGSINVLEPVSGLEALDIFGKLIK